VKTYGEDLNMASVEAGKAPDQACELANLSPREHDILMLLGQGLANQKIARNLEISERTVKAHITHILHKLGLESRLQAGLIAARLTSMNCNSSKLVAQRSHGVDEERQSDSL
jgi:DNA-binding NarL/FixJ family response regulator